MSEVAFDKKKMKDEDLQILSESLKLNTNLKQINLERNQFGFAGIKALAAVLRENTTLYYVNLNYNNLRDNSIEFIADMLKFNTALKKLT